MPGDRHKDKVVTKALSLPCLAGKLWDSTTTIIFMNLIEVLPVSAPFFDIAALVEYCDHFPWSKNYGSYDSEQ